jgi:methylglutamate dehydrogenase subunit D
VVEVLAGLPAHRKLPPGRYGSAGSEPGITLRKFERSAATLIAPVSEIAQVSVRCADSFGVTLPTEPRWVAANSIEFIGHGPGRWLVLAEEPSDRLIERLQAVFDLKASVIGQSGSLVFFEAGGPRLRDVMEKLLTIDIDPSVFGVDAAATIALAHIGTTVWRGGRAAQWRFAVGRSFEAAFLRTIVLHSAEFGLEYTA